MKWHCSSETYKVKMHEKSTEFAGTSALNTRIKTEESPWALPNTIPLFLLSLSFLLIRGHQTCPWNFASYILSGICLPCMAVWPTMTATLWTNQVSFHSRIISSQCLHDTFLSQDLKVSEGNNETELSHLQPDAVHVNMSMFQDVLGPNDLWLQLQPPPCTIHV